jgi:diguanylate cyclase (GGDEF)-like protein
VPLLTVSLFGFFIISGLTSVALDPPSLVIFHGILETASIVLGFIIFFIAWYGTDAEANMRVSIASLFILSAAILEMVHMLFYAGTLCTDTRVWVTAWIFSRLIWAVGLLYCTIYSPNTNGGPLLSGKALLYGTLMAIAALIISIISNYTLWPFLNIDSYKHPIATYAQYAAFAVNLLTLIILRRYYTDHVGKLPQLALLFAACADFSFSLAPHSPHSLNVAGHLFKALANFYVLRCMFILVIRQPYDELTKLKEETERLAQKNAKLYEDSERQHNLFEDILAKIGVIISSQLNLKETLDAIADMVADMMGSRQSAIALFSRDRRTLQVAATYGITAPPEYIPLENSLAGQVCSSKTALRIDDLTLHPEIFRPQLIFTSVRSAICAPLVNDQEIIGVIEAYSHEKSAFTEHDTLLLKALGYHAGAAVASARLFEQTKLRLAEEQFLYQIAQSSAATIDTDTIMEHCTAHAATALSADIALGFLVTDNKTNTLTQKTAIGLNIKPLTFELDRYPDLAEFAKGLTPAMTTVATLPLLKEQCTHCFDGPVMIMPLPVDRRLMGLIILAWQQFVNPDSLERISFAALVAQQIALGLEKAHLYNQVKAMALSDGLTGLANRRNFDMFLNTELRRAATLKRPLSLIMLDLDKFKIYNDTYGHPTGDKLLAQVGKILQQAVRTIDFPARYGGEEFSIILPECPNSEAMALAEKIRHSVEAGHFPDNDGTFTARITASLGVATYDPAHGSPPPDNAQFVATADDALYQAKDKGRNRVENAAVL